MFSERQPGQFLDDRFVVLLRAIFFVFLPLGRVPCCSLSQGFDKGDSTGRRVSGRAGMSSF